jgi:O-antigen ligase
VLDTVAVAAAACIGTVGVPWLLLAGVVAGGWVVMVALGAVPEPGAETIFQ